MLPPQFGRRKHRGYYRDQFETDEGETTLLLGILLALWGVYWLVVHWIDWAVGNRHGVVGGAFDTVRYSAYNGILCHGDRQVWG
jgi:hypothetical protein